jgi:hypothetical protein
MPRNGYVRPGVIRFEELAAVLQAAEASTYPLAHLGTREARVWSTATLYAIYTVAKALDIDWRLPEFMAWENQGKPLGTVREFGP